MSPPIEKFLGFFSQIGSVGSGAAFFFGSSYGDGAGVFLDDGALGIALAAQTLRCTDLARAASPSQDVHAQCKGKFKTIFFQYYP